MDGFLGSAAAEGSAKSGSWGTCPGKTGGEKHEIVEGVFILIIGSGAVLLSYG